MFFSISKNAQRNFPCQYSMAGLTINTDSGWQVATVNGVNYVYKGYADTDRLENLLTQIADQTQPEFTGNFCVFVDQQDCVSIRTSRYRSFPLWYNNESVNNLVPTADTVWSDSQCDVWSDLTVTQQTFVPFLVEVERKSLSAVEEIDKILTQRVRQIASQLDQPMRVFLSGGVDTMLVYSYILREQVPYQLVRSWHVDYDDFYISNSVDITRNWSYHQIHHWTEPCVLASGTPGDEFMLRSPYTADLLLRWHGTSINQELPNWPDSMQYQYFLSDNQQKIFAQHEQENLQFGTKQDLHFYLLDWLHNDWQHHHLGNTLTWTPLRDLELFKIMLSLPLEQQLKQIMNSEISVALIQQNAPDLIDCISPQKNHGNSMAKLQNLYKSIG